MFVLMKVRKGRNYLSMFVLMKVRKGRNYAKISFTVIVYYDPTLPKNFLNLIKFQYNNNVNFTIFEYLGLE